MPCPDRRRRRGTLDIFWPPPFCPMWRPAAQALRCGCGDGLLFRPVWALSGMAMAVLGRARPQPRGYGLWHMPLLAPRAPPGHASERALWMQAAFGLVLLGLGVVAAWALDGLVAGFTLLGGLLLGRPDAAPLACTGTSLGPQSGALGSWRMVLGGRPATASRPVHGADGAHAGARHH